MVGFTVFGIAVIIIFIMALIDYHNDPPSGFDGGMI